MSMDKCRSLPFCRTDLTTCQFASDAANLIDWVIVGHGEKIESQINTHTILFVRKGVAHINSINIDYILVEGEFMVLPQKTIAVFTAESHASVLLCRIGEDFIITDFFKSKNLSITQEKKKERGDILKANLPIDRLLETLEYHISKGLKCCGYIRAKYNELGYLLGLYYTPDQLLAFFNLILDKDAIFKCIVMEAAETKQNIEELAEAVCMTRRGFYKRFMKVFNEYPALWLVKKKADRVYKELIKNDRPLKEIMDEFNFPSPSSFNYFCIKNFNMPPGKLRKMSVKTAVNHIFSNTKKDDSYSLQLKKILLESTASGFVYINTDFIIQFENIQDKKGLEVSNSTGKCCYQRIKGREKPCESCIAQRAIKSGKREIEKKQMGDGLYFEVTAIPVNRQDGTCMGVLLKYNDITTHEAVIQKLQQAVKSAEAAQKLQSQFLTNMSHEIRTPLNSIVGFSDCLIEEQNEDLKKEYMKIIRKNNQLLLQLIDDIFKQSLIDADLLEFTFTNIPLNDLLKELEVGQIEKSRKEVELTFRYEQREQMVYTDARRVHEVLLHLINNAVKFTDRGIIKVECQSRGDVVWFGISDTGIGIPKEKQSQIFQRFVKVDNFVNGTGLGLSISQGIIEKMGGKIGVNSKEGEGSLFWFTIPVKCQIVS